jgi:hypothetical protein
MAGFLSVRPGVWAQPAPAGPAVPAGSIWYGGGVGLALYDPVANTMADTTVWAVAASSDHVWASVKQGYPRTLWHSTDRGLTWTAVSFPATDSNSGIETLWVSGSLLVASMYDEFGVGNQILTRPIDGSGGWTEVFDNGVGYVWGAQIVGTRAWFWRNNSSTARVLAYGPSGGGSATDVSGFPTGSNAVILPQAVQSNQSVCYACYAFSSSGVNASRVIRAVDNVGTNVSPFAAPTGTPTANFLDASPNSDESVVLAAYRQSTTHQLWRSTNQGASWTNVTPSGLSLNAGPWPIIRWGRTEPGMAVVLGTNHLWVSTDAGLTWTQSTNLSALGSGRTLDVD